MAAAWLVLPIPWSFRFLVATVPLFVILFIGIKTGKVDPRMSFRWRSISIYGKRCRQSGNSRHDCEDVSLDR
ncbi:hypothetical protein ACRALDRAFT_1062135 [Sodiomyces alcalophilus JCM 7366]|uniref:uncharacterized protein n=1 Tax=Sodiomyces alcalophilus JCM 7366 TaxID=591952 RepID=UPI0039B43091